MEILESILLKLHQTYHILDHSSANTQWLYQLYWFQKDSTCPYTNWTEEKTGDKNKKNNKRRTRKTDWDQEEQYEQKDNKKKKNKNIMNDKTRTKKTDW